MKKKLWGLFGLSAMLCFPQLAQAENANCAAPNVLVLFDMSGSLGSKPGSQYSLAVNALNHVLKQSDTSIRYGLKVFPTPREASSTQKVYCTVDSSLEVDFGFGVSTAIASYFEGCGGPRSDYDTPMYQALSSCIDMETLKEKDRRNYIVLITDGIQDCCNGGDYDSEPDCNPNKNFGEEGYYNDEESAENREDLINLVKTLYQNGIQTFVVGIGDKVDMVGLDGMAMAGGTAKDGCVGNGTGDCFYKVSGNDQDSLAAALYNIYQIAGQEVCDGLDNDCNGEIDDNLDLICEGQCGNDVKSGISHCVNGSYTACEVTAVPEICDGLDNNCDGQIDEGLERNCSTVCGQGKEICQNGVWSECQVPVEEEICDGQDNDCDGYIDEDCACMPGDVQSCGYSKGRCVPGIQRCQPGGVWGECEGAIGPVTEICDGLIDDDCDGYTDEDCKCTNGTTTSCGVNRGICTMGVQTCENGTLGECVGAIWPEATDVCDGLDNNCDGIIDENCSCIDGEQLTCGTNIGMCQTGIQTCEDGFWTPRCVGEIAPKDEICDNKDNNCDGLTDNKALCFEDTQCRCGICVSPCNPDGTCHSGQCVNGYCIMESCPAGYHCDGDVCVPGEVIKPEPVEPMPENGCNCHSTGHPLNLLWLGLMALGMSLEARRKHN